MCTAAEFTSPSTRWQRWDNCTVSASCTPSWVNKFLNIWCLRRVKSDLHLPPLLLIILILTSIFNQCSSDCSVARSQCWNVAFHVQEIQEMDTRWWYYIQNRCHIISHQSHLCNPLYLSTQHISRQGIPCNTQDSLVRKEHSPQTPWRQMFSFSQDSGIIFSWHPALCSSRPVKFTYFHNCNFGRI